MKKITLLVLCMCSIFAFNIYAAVPTDINKYTTQYIVKGETPINIPIKYLAHKAGTYSFGDYNAVGLTDPTGKYRVTSYQYGTSYCYYQKEPWISNYKTSSGSYYNGYSFIDLQNIVSGTWILVVVQQYAGDWYYIPADLTVTFNPNGGSVTPTSKSVTYGATYGTLPTPIMNGHNFVGWFTAANGGTQITSTNTVSMTANQTLYAHWNAKQFTLTAKVEDATMGSATGSGLYNYGSSCIITAVTNTGYHFVKWSDGNTSNPRTITVTANATYTAEFAVNQYAITTFATNGTVSGAGTYNYNTNVSLKATPNEHYHFVKWSDGNTNNPRTITVTKDSTFTAVFALDQFTITATGEHGTVIGSGTYNYGATATLTATNSDCYSFQKWSDGNTENPRSVVVTQDSTFTAIFVGTGYQETVNCTVVNESPYGTVSFTGTVIKDSNISLHATAPECSQFVKWSDNDTSNPRNLIVTQDSTLTAIFEKIQFNVSINTSDSIKGKVKMEESSK